MRSFARRRRTWRPARGTTSLAEARPRRPCAAIAWHSTRWGFGRRLRIPVMLAPIGSIESFTPDGGAAATQAAHQFGIAHMLSSVCNPGLEAVAAAAPDG